MDSTQRLSLPFILPGQAQKELYHNEALQILDTIVAAAVEQLPGNDPPNPPVVATSFIVGSSPTGDWSGNANAIATYTSAGWRFAAAVEGMVAWIKSASLFANYEGGVWQIGTLSGLKVVINGIQVVGPQAAAIADPTGGTMADAEARSAISSILSTLRQHGLIASV